MRSFFSLVFILIVLNKIICQDFQYLNNFYQPDYEINNFVDNNNNMLMIPRVESFHPPKGYQPVKGYEPPNYRPNIDNHIIFQDKPKLINSISAYDSKYDNGQVENNYYQIKNTNEYNHPLLNLNRLPETRYPAFAPINRPVNLSPFNWTNYQNSMLFFQATSTVVSHRPHLPTIQQHTLSSNYDSWRRTPTTNRFSTPMRYFSTTSVPLENTSKFVYTNIFSSSTTKPIPSSTIASAESKTTVKSTYTTTTSTSTISTKSTTIVTSSSTTATSAFTTSTVSTLPSTTTRRRKTKTKTTFSTTTTTSTTTITTTTTLEASTTTRKKTTSKSRTKTSKKTKTTRIKTTTSSIDLKTTSTTIDSKSTTSSVTSKPSKKPTTITTPIRKNNFTYTTTRKYGSKDMIIDDNCMKCLCFIESWCSDVGCVMDQGSLSCGWYQLKYEYWLDCGQPGGSWKNCSNDKPCAEQCVRQYMTRYGGLCSTGNSCADLARIHNGGPYGCSAKHTEYYGNMISRCLKRLSPYENIDELYKNTFPDEQ